MYFFPVMANKAPVVYTLLLTCLAMSSKPARAAPLPKGFVHSSYLKVNDHFAAETPGLELSWGGSCSNTSCAYNLYCDINNEPRGNRIVSQSGNITVRMTELGSDQMIGLFRCQLSSVPDKSDSVSTGDLVGRMQVANLTTDSVRASWQHPENRITPFDIQVQLLPNDFDDGWLSVGRNASEWVFNDNPVTALLPGNYSVQVRYDLGNNTTVTAKEVYFSIQSEITGFSPAFSASMDIRPDLAAGFIIWIGAMIAASFITTITVSALILACGKHCGRECYNPEDPQFNYRIAMGMGYMSGFCGVIFTGLLTATTLAFIMRGFDANWNTIFITGLALSPVMSFILPAFPVGMMMLAHIIDQKLCNTHNVDSISVNRNDGFPVYRDAENYLATATNVPFPCSVSE